MLLLPLLSALQQLLIPDEFLLQSDILQWKLRKPKHLTTRLMIFRRHTLASMHNQISAYTALIEYMSHVNAWLDGHANLVDYVVLDTALVSIVHVWKLAQTFGVTADEETTATACKLVDLFVHQQQADNRAVCNVFWSLARLDRSPTKQCEAALATMFLATQHECNLHGICNILWAMSMRSINPLNGRLLESLLHQLAVCLSDSRSVPSQETQVH